MKKILILFIFSNFILFGCQNEEKIHDDVYSKEELQGFMDKIISSKEEFLNDVTYFQNGIKPQDLSITNQKEIIWLQINKSTTELSEEEMTNMIEEKIGVPKNLFRVDLVSEKREYVPTVEPWK